MVQDDADRDGDVEIDETYVGGKRKHARRGGRPAEGDRQKTPVLGMVERGGRVVAVTVPNVKRATLQPHVIHRVLPAASVFTDELNSYTALGKAGYKHQHRAPRGLELTRAR